MVSFPRPLDLLSFPSWAPRVGGRWPAGGGRAGRLWSRGRPPRPPAFRARARVPRGNWHSSTRACERQLVGRRRAGLWETRRAPFGALSRPVRGFRPSSPVVGGGSRPPAPGGRGPFAGCRGGAAGPPAGPAHDGPDRERSREVVGPAPARTGRRTATADPPPATRGGRGAPEGEGGLARPGRGATPPRWRKAFSSDPRGCLWGTASPSRCPSSPPLSATGSRALPSPPLCDGEGIPPSSPQTWGGAERARSSPTAARASPLLVGRGRVPSGRSEPASRRRGVGTSWLAVGARKGPRARGVAGGLCAVQLAQYPSCVARTLGRGPPRRAARGSRAPGGGETLCPLPSPCVRRSRRWCCGPRLRGVCSRGVSAARPSEAPPRGPRGGGPPGVGRCRLGSVTPRAGLGRADGRGKERGSCFVVARVRARGGAGAPSAPSRPAVGLGTGGRRLALDPPGPGWRGAVVTRGRRGFRGGGSRRVGRRGRPASRAWGAGPPWRVGGGIPVRCFPGGPVVPVGASLPLPPSSRSPSGACAACPGPRGPGSPRPLGPPSPREAACRPCGCRVGAPAPPALLPARSPVGGGCSLSPGRRSRACPRRDPPCLWSGRPRLTGPRLARGESGRRHAWRPEGWRAFCRRCGMGGRGVGRLLRYRGGPFRQGCPTRPRWRSVGAG